MTRIGRGWNDDGFNNGSLDHETSFARDSLRATRCLWFFTKLQQQSHVLCSATALMAIK